MSQDPPNTPKVERSLVRRLRSSERVELNRAAMVALAGVSVAHIGLSFIALRRVEIWSLGLLALMAVAGLKLLWGTSTGRILWGTLALALALTAHNTWLSAQAGQPGLYLAVSTLLAGFGVSLMAGPGLLPLLTLAGVYLVPTVAVLLSPQAPSEVLIYFLVGALFNLLLLLTLRSRRHAIEALTGNLSRSDHSDPLTGGAMAGYLLEQGRRQVARCRHNRLAVGVLFIDLDRFKKLNLKHGYDVGDTVLVQVGEVLRASIRPTDLVGRVGGEEFVVVLSDSSRAGVEQIAARILQRLRSRTNPMITASIGIAWTAKGATLDDLIQRADGALREAKRAGRDQAVLATESLMEYSK